MSTAEEIYRKYERVAYSAARRVAKKTGASYPGLAEEALSRLGELAAEWSAKYDPAKSSPSSWVYTTTYWHLVALCARPLRKREVRLPQIHRKGRIKGEEWREEILEAPPSNWLDKLLREMSEEGQALVRILIEAPENVIASFRGNPARRRAALKNFLGTRGWSQEYIEAAWAEVAENL